MPQGGHDSPVLIRVAVAVVNVGHLGCPVIGHPVSRPNPSRVIHVRQVRRRSCGVARSIPSSATSFRNMPRSAKR